MAHTGEVTYAFAAEITKADPTPDGHLMVRGKAAGPELDLDGQICDPDWLARELPSWMEWGNIRAQHGPVAAGVGKSLTKDGESWDLLGKIVDADSKMKVMEGVYKGFSVGIKGARTVPDPRAPKGRIVGGKIVEVSLVDRPCNPTATMSLVKSAGLGEPGDYEDAEMFEGQEPGDEAYEGEPETLVPVDADGELIEPDEEQDDDLSDVTKGLIDFLRGPKPKKGKKTGGPDKHKRDRGGRFARTEARLAAKDKRLKDREAKLDERKRAVARSIMENALSSESLADSIRANQGGRKEEAMSHLANSALHARDEVSRRRVRRQSLAIGKSLEPDGEYLREEWEADHAEIEETLAALVDPAELPMSAPVYKAALALVGDILDDEGEGDLFKAADGGAVDESADIEGAQSVIAQLAELIISEARELKTGRLDEIRDIRVLMTAVEAVERFLGLERGQHGGDPGEWPRGYEDMDDDALSYVALSANEELAKRVTADEFAGVMPDSLKMFFMTSADVAKSATPGGPEGSFITAAEHATVVAKLNKTAEANEALTARLAQVEEKLTKTIAPDPQAPVAFIQTPMLTKSVTTDSAIERLRREANSPSLDPAVRAAKLAQIAALEGR